MATSVKSPEGALRALFGGRWRRHAETPVDRGITNNVSLNWRNAANTADLEGISYDSEDNLRIGGAVAVKPMRIPCIFRAVANAEVATTVFHIFNYSGKIVGISEIHNTAGNHASAVTLHVTKDPSGVTPGAGTSVMSGTFNLKGTANTKQTGTLSSAQSALGKSVVEFEAGDRLTAVVTGNAQTAAGVLLTVWVQPDVPALDVSYYSAALTSQDMAFFVANRPYTIRAMRFCHSVAETSDATANVQVTNDTSTDAPGAGTDLLTNDSNAGFDLNATANVPQVGGFTAGTSIATGNRLSVDFNSTQTEGLGVCITVTFTPQAGRLEVPCWLYDTDVTDFWFFEADRDYELYDARMNHAVAAGGALTAQVEKTAAGTGNASGGTALLNTAWNLNATANTVQVLDPVTVKATLLIQGNERLAVDFLATEQSFVGFCQTVSLLAR